MQFVFLFTILYGSNIIWKDPTSERATWQMATSHSCCVSCDPPSVAASAELSELAAERGLSRTAALNERLEACGYPSWYAAFKAADRAGAGRLEWPCFVTLVIE